MAGIDSLPKEKRLRAIRAIRLVQGDTSLELNGDSVSAAQIGQKAYGLATLPYEWTLPFLCVSADLFQLYSTRSEERKALVRQWSKTIISAAEQSGIRASDPVLIRSSGCSEGLTVRGKFHSTSGILDEVESSLRHCLEKLVSDEELHSERIPLLIQKRCEPDKARGHLSNERRCYEEYRDWMGEFESVDSERSGSFQINLRHWRRKPAINFEKPLRCAISPLISEVLKSPAEWAYAKRARVHYEWVWDGSTLYLVQADEEAPASGHDPIEEHSARGYSAVSFVPRCIRAVNEGEAAGFSKVKNAFAYLRLGLPTAPLYILDDQKLIRALARSNVPEELRLDVTAMVAGSLVIRTDVATDDLRAKQLLPRTEEMRSAPEAIRWIVKQSKELVKQKHRAAFIFHNFIPAQAAAFALATPDEPVVQIEALWGLPEGLYYNSHDKYVVDTIATDVELLRSTDTARFTVREKRHFKRFFVSTTASGKWETLVLKPPYDWKGSLSVADCKIIAYESRRIAAAEKRAVSIMWFVGVHPETADRSVIPWYHEPFDIHAARATITTRTKTSFDRCFVIRTERDIASLHVDAAGVTGLTRIRVQPSDEKLLRDKQTLRKIGQIARDMAATIVLEGAVLSHAYYQLLETGAVVEVVHPFIGFEETHALNKLVRDRVPELIKKRGESVTTATLDQEALVIALREKLVEESLEVLDAKDCKSIVAELADVREVVDALLKQLEVPAEQLESEQLRKRNQRGSFSDGTILIKTTSTLPTSRVEDHVQPLLIGLQSPAPVRKTVDESALRRRGESLEKRTDRRVAHGKVEVQLSISVPITSGPWSAETSEERIDGAKGKVTKGRVKGVRKGSNWSIELVVRIDETQPELL